MKLSRTERDVLSFFEANPGRTLTRTDIVKGVWDYQYLGLTNLVDVQVCALRSKGISILTVRGIGYRYEKPQPVVPESPETRVETFTHHNI